MPPNRRHADRSIHLDAGPNGRGWCIAFVDAASAGWSGNVACTRGLDVTFGRPDLMVRGLPRHQARGLLIRVAQRLTTTLWAADGTPTHLSAGHYSIELVPADPSEWRELTGGEPSRRTLEVLWSNRLVEDAPIATDAA